MTPGASWLSTLADLVGLLIGFAFYAFVAVFSVYCVAEFILIPLVALFG